MVQRLGMIILMQSDLQVAKAFYEALGFSTVFHVPDKWVEMTGAGIKIGLCPTAPREGFYQTGLVFEMVDVRSFYEKEVGRDIFLNEPIEKIHGIMVSVKDPSGNIFDLYQPTPEKVAALARNAAQQEESDSQKKCCGNKEACC